MMDYPTTVNFVPAVELLCLDMAGMVLLDLTLCVPFPAA